MQKVTNVYRVSQDELRKAFVFILSLIYASSFFMLSNDIFRDRENYTAYARNFEEIFFRYDSILAKMFNEPLFLFLNYISSIFLDPEYIPRFFAFIVAFSVSFFIFRSARNSIMVVLSLFLLVLMPQLIHLQLVTLRQGLGVSLIIWVVILSKNNLKIAFSIFIAGFVHSSFFIVFSMYVLDMFLSGRGCNKRYYFRLLVQLFFSILMSLVFTYLAMFFGARQAGAAHLTGDVNISGGALVLWGVVFSVFLTRSRVYFYNEQSVRLAYIGLIAYLAMYLISPLAGRFIMTFLPFIVATMVSKFSYRELSVIFLILFANVVVYANTLKNNSLTYYGAEFFNF
ncbi:MAG: EpsG family protein [Pseudomonadota bacterium]